jgi:hypothetical protein
MDPCSQEERIARVELQTEELRKGLADLVNTVTIFTKTQVAYNEQHHAMLSHMTKQLDVNKDRVSDLFGWRKYSIFNRYLTMAVAILTAIMSYGALMRIPWLQALFAIPGF